MERHPLRVLSFLLILTIFGFGLAASAKQLRPDMTRSKLAEVVITTKTDLPAIEEAGGIIDQVQDKIAIVYLLPEDFEQLRARGFSVRWIRDEAKEAGMAFWERVRRGRQTLDDYHTNEQIGQLFQQWQTSYPSLFWYSTIGNSVQNRPIYVCKVSDNVTQDEPEIEVKYVSNIHGDEVVGKENCLRFIEELLTTYQSDPELTDLMTNFEMWFVPLMNPDGHALVQRYNANGMDLNRDFPDRCDDSTNTTAGRQIETAHMMNWSAQHNFVLSANFHGGALVTNYPWDNNCTGGSVYAPTPEDCLMVHISRRYCEANPRMRVNTAFLYPDTGITNGADWYEVSGGMQDWNYVWMGDRDLTIELDNTKWPNQSRLESLWQENRFAMRYYFLEAKYGVRGIVTDSLTGAPLRANVRLFDIPYLTYSSALHGDYYRVLRPGTYSLTFTAPGYEPKTFNNVVVPPESYTVLNVPLRALPPVLDATAVVVRDPTGNNNGALDPGENATLDVTLQNIGGATAYNILAVLSTADPYVNLIVNSDDLASLTPGASGVLTYGVAVSPSAPVGHLANFTLNITATGYQNSDAFALGIGLSIERFESGNFSAYPWQFGGNLPWTVTTQNVYEGTYCARSGAITHSQTSDMRLILTVVTPGTISFYFRVSSEATYDFLRFFIDGVQQQQWSGELPWTLATFNVTTGAHTFLWRYYKDGSVSSGSDAAWVDYITFPTLAYPDINVNPASFEVSLFPGDSTALPEVISNPGSADLTYAIAVTTNNVALSLDIPHVELAKGAEDSRRGSSPLDARGGPDGYGYRWVDSDDPGGPTYSWVDISLNGTPLADADDRSYGPFNLGFTFNFYGTNYTQVRICSNGFLTLTASDSSYLNQGIPNPAAPNSFIAPFWDDLNPISAGTIYYRADGANQRFIAQWSGVAHYSGGSPETFQVILYADGTILFQYQTVGLGTSCTVGIENQTGTDGLQVVFNAPYLHNGLAIRFALQPSWLTAAPLSGTVNPGSSATVNVKFNARDLAVGVYTGNLRINTNDPDETVVDIPVTLTVRNTPDAPADLVITPVGSGAQLNWSAVSGATSYRVYRSESLPVDPVPGNLIGSSASPSYLDANPPPAKAFYAVTAVR